MGDRSQHRERPHVGTEQAQHGSRESEPSLFDPERLERLREQFRTAQHQGTARQLPTVFTAYLNDAPASVPIQVTIRGGERGDLTAFAVLSRAPNDQYVLTVSDTPGAAGPSNRQVRYVFNSRGEVLPSLIERGNMGRDAFPDDSVPGLGCIFAHQVIDALDNGRTGPRIAGQPRSEHLGAAQQTAERSPQSEAAVRRDVLARLRELRSIEDGEPFVVVQPLGGGRVYRCTIEHQSDRYRVRIEAGTDAYGAGFSPMYRAGSNIPLQFSASVHTDGRFAHEPLTAAETRVGAEGVIQEAFRALARRLE